MRIFDIFKKSGERIGKVENGNIRPEGLSVDDGPVYNNLQQKVGEIFNGRLSLDVPEVQGLGGGLAFLFIVLVLAVFACFAIPIYLIVAGIKALRQLRFSAAVLYFLLAAGSIYGDLFLYQRFIEPTAVGKMVRGFIFDIGIKTSFDISVSATKCVSGNQPCYSLLTINVKDRLKDLVAYYDSDTYYCIGHICYSSCSVGNAQHIRHILSMGDQIQYTCSLTEPDQNLDSSLANCYWIDDIYGNVTEKCVKPVYGPSAELDISVASEDVFACDPGSSHCREQVLITAKNMQGASVSYIDPVFEDCFTKPCRQYCQYSHDLKPGEQIQYPCQIVGRPESMLFSIQRINDQPAALNKIVKPVYTDCSKISKSIDIGASCP